MCGRFNLTATSQEITDHFELTRIPRHEVMYNIPPGQKILNVIQLDDHSRKGVFLHWGLIPSWSRDRKISSHLINARSETLAEKPSFRSAFKKRRCLIPATGFFEWQQTASGKQPYQIRKTDNSLFAFAGLWEYWDNEGETIYSCTIITTEANEFMQPVHNRMPVIIDYQNYNLWLDKQPNPEELQRLLEPAEYKDFRLTTISTRINNPAHNDVDCLK